MLNKIKSNMKMTDEEYILVCKELTERFKDTFFNYPNKKTFESMGEIDDYTFNVTIVGGDILQILGSIRRKTL
jgi:hypothetical protein